MLTFGNDALTAKSRIGALDDSYNLMVGNFAGAQAAMVTAKQGLLSIQQAANVAGASMSGANKQSLALQQAFYGQISTIGQTANAMVTAGDTTAQVTDFFNQQIDALEKYAGKSKAARQAIYDLRQEEAWTKLATEGLTNQARQAADTLAGQFTKTVEDAGVKSGIAKQDIGRLTTAIENTGAKSTATHEARAQMIHDLEQSGINAHWATGVVDAYIKKIAQIPHNAKTLITVSGTGVWSVSETAGPSLGIPNPTGNPIGTIPPKGAHGMYISTGHHGVDDQLILAQKGELVVPEPMVRGGAVDHLRGKIQGFSGGGVVGNYSGPLPGAGAWAGSMWGATNQAVISSVEQAMGGAISSDVYSAKMAAAGGKTVNINMSFHGITQAPSPEQMQAISLKLAGAIGTS